MFSALVFGAAERDWDQAFDGNVPVFSATDIVVITTLQLVVAAIQAHEDPAPQTPWTAAPQAMSSYRTFSTEMWWESIPTPVYASNTNDALEATSAVFILCNIVCFIIICCTLFVLSVLMFDHSHGRALEVESSLILMSPDSCIPECTYSAF